MKEKDFPKVTSYINTQLSYLCFLLYKDIDSSQLALKHLKNTEVPLNNVLIMTEDFNIHDNFWDSNYSFHSSNSNLLIDLCQICKVWTLTFLFNLFFFFFFDLFFFSVNLGLGLE